MGAFVAPRLKVGGNSFDGMGWVFAVLGVGVEERGGRSIQGVSSVALAAES